jgi:hypothetical protein
VSATSAASVVWLTIFSIYRYAVPLELISAPLVIGVLVRVRGRPRMAAAVAALVCLLLAVWTKSPDWGACHGPRPTSTWTG